LFNAAFFAGLEIPEYQMHGLYISRYPYGREATLSYPRPDLKVRNNSPYGVLVWPTYSGTSITVSLYSTKWVEEVTQSNQTTSEQGPCKVVTTERTRRWLDGRTAVDRFSGRYAPAEGVQCQ
jgi:vancomycin resistance protein YoaR